MKAAKQLHFATLSRSVIPYPLFSGVWRAGGWGAGSKHGERYIRQLRGVLRRHGHPLRTRGSRPPHSRRVSHSPLSLGHRRALSGCFLPLSCWSASCGSNEHACDAGRSAQQELDILECARVVVCLW